MLRVPLTPVLQNPLATVISGNAASGYVKSIQPFTITIAAGSTSNTATITSVDTSKAVIFPGGFLTDNTGTDLSEVMPRLSLTNATTITAQRNTSDAVFTVTVRGTIVEFESRMVESVQYGTITLTAATSNTATITSVDTTRSVILPLGWTTTYTSSVFGVGNIQLTLTDATTVTCTRSTGIDNITAGFVVVQFKAAVISSVQQRTINGTGTGTASTDTITSVDTSRSILFHRGINTTSSAWNNSAYHGVLTNGTTVTYTRNTSNITSRTMYYTVVEFASGILSVQRNTTAIAGTSADTTISAVDTAASFVKTNGFLTANTVPSWPDIFPTATLLDTTTVRAQKGASATSSTVAWEVVTFL